MLGQCKVCAGKVVARLRMGDVNTTRGVADIAVHVHSCAAGLAQHRQIPQHPRTHHIRLYRCRSVHGCRAALKESFRGKVAPPPAARVKVVREISLNQQQ